MCTVTSERRQRERKSELWPVEVAVDRLVGREEGLVARQEDTDSNSKTTQVDLPAPSKLEFI